MMKKIGKIYAALMKKHENAETKGKEMKEEKKKMTARKSKKLQKYL